MLPDKAIGLPVENPSVETLLRRATQYVLELFGDSGYDFWKAAIKADEIVLVHPDDPALEIEVLSVWDRVTPGGPIRVFVSLFKVPPAKDYSGWSRGVPTSGFLVQEDGGIDTGHEGPHL